jgi:hypothetical protein
MEANESTIPFEIAEPGQRNSAANIVYQIATIAAAILLLLTATV